MSQIISEFTVDFFLVLCPLALAGGFIPSVDHQTPPDVSFDHYHCYLALLAEYARKGAQGV